jgi:hypothetical protein
MFLSAILGAIFIPAFIKWAEQKIIERAQRNTVAQPISASSQPIPRHLYLLDQPQISEKQIIAFLMKNNPNLEKGYVEKIAKLYCAESKQESINTAIAVAQMALETVFFTIRRSSKKNAKQFRRLRLYQRKSSGPFFRNGRGRCARAHSTPQSVCVPISIDYALRRSPVQICSAVEVFGKSKNGLRPRRSLGYGRKLWNKANKIDAGFTQCFGFSVMFFAFFF